MSVFNIMQRRTSKIQRLKASVDKNNNCFLKGYVLSGCLYDIEWSKINHEKAKVNSQHVRQKCTGLGVQIDNSPSGYFYKNA
jgi:hypothetical protein